MYLPGKYTLDQILEIRKAFEANTAQNGATPFVDDSSGAALSMQSLDKTFVAIVSSDKDFSFLSSVPKRNTKQVLAEYNKQISHGGGWHASSFIGQSDEPNFRDSVLERLFDEVCYIGESFDYNKVVDTVDNVQDPSLIQGNSALKRGMENLTRSGWFGKKKVNPLTHDGFLEKVGNASSDFVIDSRGQLPSAEEIKSLSADIRTKYFGVVNDAWMHNNTKALYDQYYDGNNRSFVYQNNSQNPGNVGLSNVITGMYDSNARDEYIRFKTDIFMDKHTWTVPKRYDRGTKTMVEGPTDYEKSPEIPVIALAVQTGTPGSKFSASDAGVYNYRVAAGERIHWSQACVEQSATVAAGGAVEVTITPPVTGVPATRFAIFRSIRPGSNDIRYMLEVSRNTMGASTIHLDKNDDLPGTTIMVVGDFNAKSTVDENRTVMLTELLPFTKTLFPYGAGGKLRMRLGMVEWYGVLQIFTEEKFRVFKNVPVRL
jgi:hypothetical protein